MTWDSADKLSVVSLFVFVVVFVVIGTSTCHSGKQCFPSKLELPFVLNMECLLKINKSNKGLILIKQQIIKLLQLCVLWLKQGVFVCGYVGYYYYYL